MEVYADEVPSEGNSSKKNIFSRIFQILMQLCFGIFCGAVIIIMVVPMLLYIIGCLITGKEAHFNIRNFSKRKK